MPMMESLLPEAIAMHMWNSIRAHSSAQQALDGMSEIFNDEKVSGKL